MTNRNEHGGKDGWVHLPQEQLPIPTYWPAVMAVGITGILWGLVTSLVITAVGGVLMAVAASGWIMDIKNE